MRTMFLGCVLLAGALAGAEPAAVDLVPALAKTPYVFAAEPNAFAGKQDFRSTQYPLSLAGLVDHGALGAVVVRVRATDDDTHAVELGFHQADGKVWGSSSVPIRRGWSDVVMPIREMGPFTHWHGHPAVKAGELADVRTFKTMHVCFGKWLCRDTLKKAHGFEIASVTYMKLPDDYLKPPRDRSLDEFPRKPGEEDDTARLERAIRACRGAVLTVPRGEYRISSTLYVDNGCSFAFNKSATLLAVKEMPCMIEITHRDDRRNANDFNRFFSGGRIDGNGLASCVRVAGFPHFTMKDALFLNGKAWGLRVDGGYEMIANNLYFKCVIPGLAGNSAMYINGGDSHYTDCVAVDYTIGVNEVRGGCNRFTRCHVWGGPLPPAKPGEDREMLKDSINFRICGGSTVLRDCYADTGKTGYEIRGWETRLLGCQYFNNASFKLDDVTIIRQTAGGRLLVSECGFCKNMPHTKVYEGNGSVVWHNMVYSGFGAQDDCPGALQFGKQP